MAHRCILLFVAATYALSACVDPTERQRAAAINQAEIVAARQRRETERLAALKEAQDRAAQVRAQTAQAIADAGAREEKIRSELIIQVRAHSACIRQQARSLASISAEPAETVARAALAACSSLWPLHLSSASIAEFERPISAMAIHEIIKARSPRTEPHPTMEPKI